MRIDVEKEVAALRAMSVGQLCQVLPDGLEFEGNRYKSLSAVAKAVTGSHCNGYRSFNLEGAR